MQNISRTLAGNWWQNLATVLSWLQVHGHLKQWQIRFSTNWALLGTFYKGEIAQRIGNILGYFLLKKIFYVKDFLKQKSSPKCCQFFELFHLAWMSLLEKCLFKVFCGFQKWFYLSQYFKYYLFNQSFKTQPSYDVMPSSRNSTSVQTQNLQLILSF